MSHHLPALRQCPHCGSEELFHNLVALRSLTMDLLPGSGALAPQAKVVVCADCGLMTQFLQPIQRGQVRRSKEWQRIDPGKSQGEA